MMKKKKKKATSSSSSLLLARNQQEVFEFWGLGKRKMLHPRHYDAGFAYSVQFIDNNGNFLYLSSSSSHGKPTKNGVRNQQRQQEKHNKENDGKTKCGLEKITIKWKGGLVESRPLASRDILFKAEKEGSCEITPETKTTCNKPSLLKARLVYIEGCLSLTFEPLEGANSNPPPPNSGNIANFSLCIFVYPTVLYPPLLRPNLTHRAVVFSASYAVDTTTDICQYVPETDINVLALLELLGFETWMFSSNDSVSNTNINDADLVVHLGAITDPVATATIPLLEWRKETDQQLLTLLHPQDSDLGFKQVVISYTIQHDKLSALCEFKALTNILLVNHEFLAMTPLKRLDMFLSRFGGNEPRTGNRPVDQEDHRINPVQDQDCEDLTHVPLLS